MRWLTLRHFILAALIPLVGLASPVCADENPELSFEQFINSREVVATVYFATGSHQLDQESRGVLERIAPELKGISPDEKVLRIEGFSSPEGKELANVRLSMERAAAVELFLRDISGITYDRYLVGMGVRDDQGLTNAKQRRVDIAIYDNVLNVDWDKSERIVIDGHRD
ncbi:MAG: hypothetical protein D6751_06305 [Deltaproteobacteria bacterium]|nr:MAG: hypothetical protein D6751_06305 [Deltaproteobacteria bacterium]